MKRGKQRTERVKQIALKPDTFKNTKLRSSPLVTFMKEERMGDVIQSKVWDN